MISLSSGDDDKLRYSSRWRAYSQHSFIIYLISHSISHLSSITTISPLFSSLRSGRKRRYELVERDLSLEGADAFYQQHFDSFLDPARPHDKLRCSKPTTNKSGWCYVQCRRKQGKFPDCPFKMRRNAAFDASVGGFAWWKSDDHVHTEATERYSERIEPACSMPVAQTCTLGRASRAR